MERAVRSNDNQNARCECRSYSRNHAPSEQAAMSEQGARLVNEKEIETTLASFTQA